MKPIDIKKVKIKNHLGIIDQPTYEDVLFEVVNFLNDERRYDGEFKVKEAYLKTKIRVGKDLSEDLTKLVEMGYIDNPKQSVFRVVKHLWEDINI